MDESVILPVWLRREGRWAVHKRWLASRREGSWVLSISCNGACSRRPGPYGKLRGQPGAERDNGEGSLRTRYSGRPGRGSAFRSQFGPPIFTKVVSIEQLKLS